LPGVTRDERSRAPTDAELPLALALWTIDSAAAAGSAADLEEIELGVRVAAVVFSKVRMATVRAARYQFVAVAGMDAR
jgi:hypothetical protein